MDPSKSLVALRLLLLQAIDIALTSFAANQPEWASRKLALKLLEAFPELVGTFSAEPERRIDIALLQQNLHEAYQLAVGKERLIDYLLWRVKTVDRTSELLLPWCHDAQLRDEGRWVDYLPLYKAAWRSNILPKIFPKPAGGFRVYRRAVFAGMSELEDDLNWDDPRSEMEEERYWEAKVSLTADDEFWLERFRRLDGLDFYWHALYEGRQFPTLRWIARTFPLFDATIAGTFAALYVEQNSREEREFAEWLFAHYRDKFDWKSRECGLAVGRYFEIALLNDRPKAARWLTKTFDVREALTPELFRGLFALNNVAAVRWLFDTFAPVAEQIVEKRSYGEPANLLWLLEQSGRHAMAQLVERRYGVRPRVSSKSSIFLEDVVKALSQPPPPTVNLTETSEGWRSQTGTKIPSPKKRFDYAGERARPWRLLPKDA